MPLQLPATLTAWGTADFPDVLKGELAALARELPLQQALSNSSAVASDKVEVMLIAHEADADHIRAKVGVFFSGIVAGCNCADDPTPLETQNEYCELWLDIDRWTAEASVRIA